MKIYGLSDFRKDINKSFPYGTKLKSKELKLILGLYYSKVKDEIIFNNYEYKIPYIGNIMMVKQKMVIQPGVTKRVVGCTIDRKSSRDLETRIMHENEHTNGYVFRILWNNRLVTKNINRYKFRAERYSFNRYLAKILKNRKKYGVVDAPIINR